MSFTNITIFPNKDKKEGDNKPDLNLVASWKVGEEYKNVTVGALWKKEGANGNFYSGSMKDGYTNKDGKEMPGFVITRSDAQVAPAPVEPPTAADVVDIDEF